MTQTFAKVGGSLCCTHCHSHEIVKRGKDDTQVDRQRYRCKTCGQQFDDLSGSVFAGRHQPLRVWVGGLYLMGLNLSNAQIAQELDLAISNDSMCGAQPHDSNCQAGECLGRGVDRYN